MTCDTTRRREALFYDIINALIEMPPVRRLCFVQTRYRRIPLEDVALNLGLDKPQVAEMVALAQRQLENSISGQDERLEMPLPDLSSPLVNPRSLSSSGVWIRRRPQVS